MDNVPALVDCKPGLRATGFAMIVAVEKVPERTSGGIFLTDDHREREKLVRVQGRVVSMSPACFDFASFPPGTAPQVGDVVQFARLAGVVTKGRDDRDYRVLQDRDVIAIVEEDA